MERDPAYNTIDENAQGPIKVGEFELKDTGHRKVFDTGAQRDAAPGKGWPHCVPCVAKDREAKWYEAGGQKYGRHNWREGIPLSNYLDSASRHLDKLMDGQMDEDHAAAVRWNMGCFIWTQQEILAGRLPGYLADVPPHRTWKEITAMYNERKQAEKDGTLETWKEKYAKLATK